ncbi:MAG: amino acid adenylation domain-containing protein, partial [Bacteroidota bacterium]
EIMEAYDAYKQKQNPPRKEEDQYKDYIQYIAQNKTKYEEELFWKNYLHNIKEGSLLPFAARTTRRNKAGRVVRKKEWTLSARMTEQLQQYAQEHHLTINTIIQGLWAILLAQYTGKSEVVFGVTVSGRPADLAEVNKKVGLYINTIPLGIRIDKEQTVLECFQQIQHGHSQAREYQYTALNAIQRWCGISGDFFDSILVFENYFVEDDLAQKSQKLKVRKEKTLEQTNYLLGIKFYQTDQLHLEFDYQSDLLEEVYVDVIKNHFEEAIAQLLLQTDPRVGVLSGMSAHEKQQLIDTFNQQQAAYPTNKTLMDLFTEQVRKYPTATALVFQDQQWSYQELEDRSNALAAYLKKEKTGNIIAHYFDKSLEMIVAILGILKAGAAYVPIDPAYPQKRMDYILDDTKVNTLLTLGKHQNLFTGEHQRIICLDRDWNTIANEATSRFTAEGTVENLAYIIYTSGTSGHPKGVRVQHQNLVNLALAQIDGFGLNPQDKTLQFSSLGFDASCSEIFTALLSGGTLVIPTKEDLLDPDRLGRLLTDQEVDIVTLPPSYQVVMKERLKSLKKLVSAGEQLNAALTQELNAAGVKVINAYGPTENTVCVSLTSEPILQNGDITIGKPLNNVQVYIVDEAMNLLPIGVVGEIVVGGQQVAQGYLNRPDLTKDKFVKAPDWLNQEGVLYKTGDFGRWHPDGNIVYLGRKDDQLKIRGYRIE